MKRKPLTPKQKREHHRESNRRYAKKRRELIKAIKQRLINDPEFFRI